MAKSKAKPKEDDTPTMPAPEVMAEYDKLSAKYRRLRDKESPKAQAAFDELMAFKIENGLVEEVADDEDESEEAE